MVVRRAGDKMRSAAKGLGYNIGMYNEEHNARRFYAISFADDEPTVTTGSLIPRKQLAFTPKTLALPARPARQLLVSRVVIALATLVFAVYGAVTQLPDVVRSGGSLLANTIESMSVVPVVIEHPYTKKVTPLTYGIEVAFSEPDFFAAAREGFIEASRTFIEADLTTMRLRYFEQGVLYAEYPIIKKGESGTFWETPAGLYEVELKKDKHFATFGQVYLPHSIAFQGNFYIHGTPFYETGELATSTKQGGIELKADDAADLFSLVSLRTPVLVYERAVAPDDFLYEPKVPELATPHYLIADVDSSTVLAASDLDESVPIASLTKLMTAVVAAEYINLDTRVQITTPTFVQSLIPRLGERSSVSMYSLLELLLLESSNEAAEVIAGEVGREQFIAYMNERAKSLGMEQTHFTDPSGLDAGNVSSVGDLLRLIQYIYEKRRFIVDISAGKKLPDIYVSGEFSGLSNFNDVQGLDNFIGGKIGETNAAGQTSVTLHTLEVKGVERVVAIIILGSSGRTEDVTALMQYATERFGN
jgi:serine-type D-Ala-D-Ala endopeptidase (penicillin-binding protein 7)